MECPAWLNERVRDQAGMIHEISLATGPVIGSGAAAMMR